MNVLNLARSLASTHTSIEWAGGFANHVYDFDALGIPSGDALKVVEAFHLKFSRFMDGQWIPREYYHSNLSNLLPRSKRESAY
jgi:hypothetical protein